MKRRFVPCKGIGRGVSGGVREKRAECHDGAGIPRPAKGGLEIGTEAGIYADALPGL